jgi:hypothetical protein
LDLLLAHGDDGTPVLQREADPSTAAAGVTPVERREERFLADITAGASDLERQGWAVVVPAGAQGARLEALVQALVQVRAEDQQADVVSIRVPPGMDTATAIEWKKDVYPTLYGEDEARRPRYLLILGDLDQVSLDTQQVLSHDGLTGRLACASDDGYAAYVDKVLAWQRAPSREDRARAMFYTVHDGTSATAAGHAKLIQPCHDRCARTARDKPRAFAASAVEAHGAKLPDPDELLTLVAANHPSVLMSMSHGMGPPRRRPWTPAEARERQGAMSFGAEGALEAADVASAPFLPGGMWIYFACFGAGTPRTSAYHHWLEMLEREGMSDLGPIAATLRGLDQAGGFVSALAKAALANPDGPLAVLGHIDLAWSYSYEELRVSRTDSAQRITGSNRSLNFFQLMSKLVAGERVGAAALALKLQLGAVGAELTAHYDRCKRGGGPIEGATPADVLALGNLWMLHQDLLGYAVLGDPAVRLPLAGGGGRGDRTRTAPVDAAPDRAGTGLPAVRGAGDAEVDAGELDWLERAAIAVASGDSPGVAAAELGVPRSELIEAAGAYRAAGRAALRALLVRRGGRLKGSRS